MKARQPDQLQMKSLAAISFSVNACCISQDVIPIEENNKHCQKVQETPSLF